LLKTCKVVLKFLTFDLLRDQDGLNLREYKLSAIQAAETSQLLKLYWLMQSIFYQDISAGIYCKAE
jgi:hypothetical protein